MTRDGDAWQRYVPCSKGTLVTAGRIYTPNERKPSAQCPNGFSGRLFGFPLSLYSVETGPHTSTSNKRLAWTTCISDTHGLMLRKQEAFSAKKGNELAEGGQCRWMRFSSHLNRNMLRWKDETPPGRNSPPFIFMKAYYLFLVSFYFLAYFNLREMSSQMPLSCFLIKWTCTFVRLNPRHNTHKKLLRADPGARWATVPDGIF